MPRKAKGPSPVVPAPPRRDGLAQLEGIEAWGVRFFDEETEEPIEPIIKYISIPKIEE